MSFRRPSTLFRVVSVVPCHALALPLSYAPAGTVKTYVPLIAISVSLFFVVFVFLAIKSVYVKQRRIRTIHTPPVPVTHSSSGLSTCSTSSFGIQDKRANRNRGLLVGFLGSPTWETNLTSKLGRTTWRYERRGGYHLHTSTSSATRSTRCGSACSKSKCSSSGSHLAKSTALTSYTDDVDALFIVTSSGPSHIPVAHGSNSSKTFGSTRRHGSNHFCTRYGDFGECYGVRSLGGIVPSTARRVSPSSIRLVNGSGHGDRVDYSFLSRLPPHAVVVSPLMGTRDSIQLSRCSVKHHRKPVPPLPSLPPFLPLYVLNGSESRARSSEYLPSLRFSPLAAVAKAFHSQQHVLEEKAPSGRVADLDGRKHAVSESTPPVPSRIESAHDAGSLTNCFVAQQTPPLHSVRKANPKSDHKGLAIEGPLTRTMVPNKGITAVSPKDKRGGDVDAMQTSVARSLSVSSGAGSVVFKKPLKSCLRRHSVAPTSLVGSPDVTLTPSMSEGSIRASTLGTRQSLGDQASLRTPILDVDMGILGLDRFRWNENDVKELRVQSCHMKKDSITLVPAWE